MFAVLAFVMLNGAAMSDEDEPLTAGGSSIHRYDGHQYEFRSPVDAGVHLEKLETFLQAALGPQAGVYHEIISDKVHIDILIYAPTESRDCWTFVTSGMSDLPMKVPEILGEDRALFSRSELLISLPRDWFDAGDNGLPIDSQMGDDSKFWPIGLLKHLARFPHEFDTWLWDGHSIPNFDPPEPYHPSTRLNGSVLYLGMGSLSENQVMELDDSGAIAFHTVVPVYGDEMTYKLNKGSDALLEKLLSHGVTDILDPNRPSVVQKRSLFDFFSKS